MVDELFLFRRPGESKSLHWVKLTELKTYKATACIPLFRVKIPLPFLQRRLLRKISHLGKYCVWNINAVRRSLSTPSQELAMGTSCPFSVPTVHQTKTAGCVWPYLIFGHSLGYSSSYFLTVTRYQTRSCWSGGRFHFTYILRQDVVHHGGKACKRNM